MAPAPATRAIAKHHDNSFATDWIRISPRTLTTGIAEKTKLGSLNAIGKRMTGAVAIVGQSR